MIRRQMKALSFTQPWASLVALGPKGLETRSWKPWKGYRGPIAIHASAGFPVQCRELAGKSPFKEALAKFGIHAWQDLPRGAVLAISEIVDCIPTERVTRYTLESNQPLFEVGGDCYGITPGEFEFGDFSQNRYAWIMGEAKLLAEPIPTKGRLGLWDWEAPLESLC